MALGHLALRGLGNGTFNSSPSFLALRGIEPGIPSVAQVDPLLVTRGLGNGTFDGSVSSLALRGLRGVADLGIAVEIETAMPISSGRVVAISPATETDTAISLTGVSGSVASPATETDSAVSITPSKSRTVGITAETDTPVGLTPGTEINDSIWPDQAPFYWYWPKASWPLQQNLVHTVTETDSALAFTPYKTRALPVTTSTETAQPIVADKTRALATVTETDTAVHIPGQPHLINVGTVTDTQTAVSIAASRIYPVTVATETDAAQALSGTKSAALGINTEADAAQLITVSGGIPYVPSVPVTGGAGPKRRKKEPDAPPMRARIFPMPLRPKPKPPELPPLPPPVGESELVALLHQIASPTESPPTHEEVERAFATYTEQLTAPVYNQITVERERLREIIRDDENALLRLIESQKDDILYLEDLILLLLLD